MVDKPVSIAEREFGYSEALASWTTRYLDTSGFECQLSLEAETGADVLKKAEAAIAYLSESKCIPLPLIPRKSNGQGKEPNTGSTKEIQKVGPSGNPICPIHGIEMKRWTKGDRTWYSHRWEGGWCKGGLS